jgi:hypothetical protein
MTQLKKMILVAAMIICCAVVSLPFWGWGVAAYLDSKRIVLSRVPSPDGMRVAQVERIIVGGTPSIVVIVRPQWMPDWYIAGCAAASHYEDAEAQAHWSTNNAITVTDGRDPHHWSIGSAPFHNAPCGGLNVTVDTKPS